MPFAMMTLQSGHARKPDRRPKDSIVLPRFAHFTEMVFRVGNLEAA